MQLSEFDFHLPKELIAQEPLRERNSSRLFVYDRETDRVQHFQFQDITKFLGPNDVLVLNNSKVLPARIRFENKEILLIEDIPPSIPPERGEGVIWKCMVRKGKFFQEGRTVNFDDGTTATVLNIDENGLREIEFKNSDFDAFLKNFGEMPTPPYIEKILQEQERYQTVYAEKVGSVAAPTAGLHFTPEILSQLKRQGVQIEYITLHVGPGTFLPVQSENVSEHQMHSERFELSKETSKRLNEVKSKGKKITAVGSTSLRTLESCWNNESLQPQVNTTDLFLYPPAQFHFVDHLLTNFHLPKSTLLMLIAAFLSPEKTDGTQKVHKLYQEAIEEKYRFFSFGDAMFIR